MGNPKRKQHENNTNELRTTLLKQYEYNINTMRIQHESMPIQYQNNVHTKRIQYEYITNTISHTVTLLHMTTTKCNSHTILMQHDNNTNLKLVEYGQNGNGIRARCSYNTDTIRKQY